MSITARTGTPRRKPEIGDRRSTKKYGDQIRVVLISESGAWVKSHARYCYVWRTPRQLVGSWFEYLLSDEERERFPQKQPLGYMQQRGAA